MSSEGLGPSRETQRAPSPLPSLENMKSLPLDPRGGPLPTTDHAGHMTLAFQPPQLEKHVSAVSVTPVCVILLQPPIQVDSESTLGANLQKPFSQAHHMWSVVSAHFDAAITAPAAYADASFEPTLCLGKLRQTLKTAQMFING